MNKFNLTDLMFEQATILKNLGFEVYVREDSKGPLTYFNVVTKSGNILSIQQEDSFAPIGYISVAFEYVPSKSTGTACGVAKLSDFICTAEDVENLDKYGQNLAIKYGARFYRDKEHYLTTQFFKKVPF